MIAAVPAANFRRAMSRRMPQGWKIRCNFERQGDHHQLTGYEITYGETVLMIGTGGQCEAPEGWTVRYGNRAFYNEITITAPDGTSVMIDDSALA